MARFSRTLVGAVALAVMGLGTALVTGATLPAAAAAGCTASAVTDKLDVSVLPNSNVRAFTKVKASFSGSISDGHCAGDSFSFAIPATLTAQNGATYALKAPDGSVVANLTISGGTATVTLTAFVETHHNVTLQGFFDARIDGSTSPGGTDDISWDVNGTSSTPIQMGSCPNCTSLPTHAHKSGQLINGRIFIALVTRPSTVDRQVYDFTDTLTSAGQQFDCPVTSTAGFFSSRTQWGLPIFTKKNVPVTITSCTATAVVGSITVPKLGSCARIALPVAVTDPSVTSWSDDASVSSNGHTDSTSTQVQNYSGGGSGDGNNPTTSPPPTPTTSPASSPATSPASSPATSPASSPATSPVSSSSGSTSTSSSSPSHSVEPTSTSRNSTGSSTSPGATDSTSGGAGIEPTSVSRRTPTGIDAGGGPASGVGHGELLIGIVLLVAGVVGLLLAATRRDVTAIRIPRGRHVRR